MVLLRSLTHLASLFARAIFCAPALNQVVNGPVILIMYQYPFLKAGPTAVEQADHGWMFSEHAPGGRNFFTRAEVARVVVERYKQMYSDEDNTSTKEDQVRIPGVLNRSCTNGM